MVREKRNDIFRTDWILIAFYLIFLSLGWMAIYSVTSHTQLSDTFSLATKYGKQLLWIGVTIPVIFVILAVDSKFYERFASIFYLVGLALLLGVLLFGKNINGATSWYSLGGITIQPSEIAKATTALAIAKLLNDKLFDLKNYKYQKQALFLLITPILLVLLQPDAGSALVFLSFFLLLYREGLPNYYILIGVFVIVLFLATLRFGEISVIITSGILTALILLYFYFFKKRKKRFRKYWLTSVSFYAMSIVFIFSVNFIFNNILKQHHRNRFNSVLGKEVSKAATYNNKQALISIASGGFTGKGFLQGDRTQGSFIPEQETDYIFTSIGEEWGFLGASFMIILFVLFIMRIIRIAERQKSKFSRVYGYCVAVLFFVHFAVNVGMVVGIVPTIGIPLPFFSYGGSSLIGFTMLLFIFIKLDANRTNEW